MCILVQDEIDFCEIMKLNIAPGKPDINKFSPIGGPSMSIPGKTNPTKVTFQISKRANIRSRYQLRNNRGEIMNLLFEEIEQIGNQWLVRAVIT